ncbi:MAG: hypothetical protein WAO76_10065 [Georgfuchsia sp.]
MHLDFVAKRRPAGPAGWLLLLFGVLGAAVLITWDMAHLQPINAAREQKLRTLQAAIEGRRAAVPKMDDAQLLAEWTRAMAVADELNLPWETLFTTLEAAAEQPVAILSLEPDAVKHELVLGGEARNLEAMLAYYRRLQQQPIFSGLELHTHQINRQDRENPIRFRITAKWAEKS